MTHLVPGMTSAAKSATASEVLDVVAIDVTELVMERTNPDSGG